jgi:hypothetical protein
MSNYAPLPGELHCIRHYIRMGEEELSRLDADLATLEATTRKSESNVVRLLEQLQSAQAILQLNQTAFDAKLAQRVVVADDLVQKRATLRPIRLLPNEMLACIFEFCVRSQERERRERLCGQGDAATGGDWQRLCILSIAGVCKRWREIVVSMKHLWKFIHIGAQLLDDEDGNWEAVRYFAANASGTPLDVFINDFPAQTDVDIDRFRACISKITTSPSFWYQSRSPLNSLAVGTENVFDFIEPFSGIRTNKFVLRVYNPEKEDDLDQQGPNIFSTDFFYSVQDARLFFIPSLLYPIPMRLPNLRHLEILVSDSLREGQTSTAHNWIWPLLESAALESFILRVSHSNVGFDIEPFSHSTLRSLDLQVEDLEGLELPFQWISLPSLRHLAICTHNAGEFGLRSPFNVFLRRLLEAGAQVQHLQVRGSPTYRKDQKFGWVIDNLPCLPHLRRLEMHEPGDVTLILEALSGPIPHASFGSPLLSSYLIPALESVVLDGVTFEDAALREFTDCRRREGKASGAGFVQSLEAVTVNGVEVLNPVVREVGEDMMN